jgi:hypothetical protein
MATDQTPADRAFELAYGQSCADVWGWSFYHEPDKHTAFDGRFSEDGKLVALYEFKARQMQWGDYSTIYLSLKKAHKILRHARFGKARAFFVVWPRKGVNFYWVDLARIRSLIPIQRLTWQPRSLSFELDDIYEIPIKWFQHWSIKP